MFTPEEIKAGLKIAGEVAEHIAPEAMQASEKLLAEAVSPVLESAFKKCPVLRQYYGFSDLRKAFTSAGETIPAARLQLEDAASAEGMARLIGKAGPEELKHITQLDLHGYPTNDSLHLLNNFPNVKSLSVCWQKVGDAGMEPVGKMTGLTSLRLCHTEVGDAGLSHIKGLTHLENLELIGGRTTGKGFSNLSEMSNLKRLDLSHAPVNDNGVSELCKLMSSGKLPNLREIDLGDTKITDAALRELALVGDNLGVNSKLESLSIGSLEDITDKGFERLGSLYNLKTVNVGSTPITRRAVDRLVDRFGGNLEVVNPPRQASVRVISNSGSYGDTRYYYPGEGSSYDR